MNSQDIKSLAVKAREDGSRLFGVCELIYMISIIGVWIVGIVGVLTTVIAIAQAGLLFGVAIGFSFFIFCAVIYVGAVLSTHVAKVLVHTSFASVAIIEHLSQSSSIKHQNDNDSAITEPKFSENVDEIEIQQPEAVINEANTLFERLSLYGYQMKKYDSKLGKWLISNGSSDFHQSISELRDLLRNFEK